MKRNNMFKKTIALFLVLIILSVPLVSYGEGQDTLEDNLLYFYQVKELVKDNYAFDINDNELIQGAIKGLFYFLDDYSNYYTKAEFEELLGSVSGNFVGVGIVVSEKDGYVVVVEPIEGSPAHKAGMKSKDKVISVDGKNTIGLSSKDVVALIKGEKGTKVKIGVKREGQASPIYFTLTRDEIKLNPISYKILDKNIGYIKINQFNENTNENLIPVLKEFDKKNISKIIIDLRDNPGGLLGEVVEVSRHFVPKGPIVHIKYKNKIEQTYYSELPKTKYKLVVLVNENSASASEIFAGAVQDTKAGTIVGVTTFGKGTVQEILPLSNGDGMKLTVAEYLTPKKRSINGKGVVPDVVVEASSSAGTKDPQLEKAMKILQ
ncbi:S41 family peptidase [Sporanaerobacter acetigenes]|uniref:S41 family peptidase n=1 Tax=Sporanaerobacter acetigenes TaxID=165813 RepID=UPI0033296745